MKSVIAYKKIQNENRAWVCSVCGATYNRPQNWNPKQVGYCMKCKSTWEEIEIENEN